MGPEAAPPSTPISLVRRTFHVIAPAVAAAAAISHPALAVLLPRRSPVVLHCPETPAMLQTPPSACFMGCRADEAERTLRCASAHLRAHADAAPGTTASKPTRDLRRSPQRSAQMVRTALRLSPATRLTASSAVDTHPAPKSTAARPVDSIPPAHATLRTAMYKTHPRLSVHSALTRTSLKWAGISARRAELRRTYLDARANYVRRDVSPCGGAPSTDTRWGYVDGALGGGSRDDAARRRTCALVTPHRDAAPLKSGGGAALLLLLSRRWARCRAQTSAVEEGQRTAGQTSSWALLGEAYTMVMQAPY
ncbi:hypothetical protein HYPSUDRAFT_208902 [Hypholoma sublateritium FD-334 SS-4]|uniref:Uncharacterized protein n=1 Tax=Hypholoma sublateritium (strain FD-334 SS-4) TaxID=945553 RepID=A0A0D2NCD4_HYPSF|nr:hypothetical protein HYPSUDRAFT_208902 [Hypholoma sublateritium FD-334 SS-4]